MGQSHSRTPSREPIPNGQQVMDVIDPADATPRRGRKRRSAKGDEVETKKVAKLNTCAYVYQKLFIQGEDSDITIAACGREWRAHKLYLKQTKYFESMFEGPWAESKSGRVDMEITDPNIDADGLNAVLGSLYHNEIEIDLDKIEGTVAAASYIVLESVTEKCAEMMIDALSTNNAVRYYELSTCYGLDRVREKSMDMLLHQFWRLMNDREKMKDIDENLLVTLLTSPNLFIVEGEYDLYKTLRWWIYIKEKPDCDIYLKPEEFEKLVSKYIREAEPDLLFLKYSDILVHLRIQQFLTCSESINTVKADGLIPVSIINEITSDLWMSLLQNEENPKSLEIDDNEFFRRCNRLGRTLDSFPKCWRWVGFNLGVDLLLHVSDFSVSIKRNSLNQKAPYSVNLKSTHLLHYRLVICDSKGVTYFDSGKSTWEMKPDEAKTICRMDEDITTPISVHFQYLVHRPIDSAIYVRKYVLEKQLLLAKSENDDDNDDDEDDEEDEDE